MKEIFLSKKFVIKTLTFTLLFILIYFGILIVYQWLITGLPPENFGLFSKPYYSKYANYEENVFLWIESKYILKELGSTFDFYWSILISYTTFAILLIFSLISGINITLSKFISSLSRKLVACNTAAGITGVSFITPAIAACPSCGVAAISSISQGIMFTISGTTLGFSALIISIMDIILLIGILINIIIFIYLIKNFKKLIKIKKLKKIDF